MGCGRARGLPLLALLGFSAAVLLLAAHSAAGQPAQHNEDGSPTSFKRALEKQERHAVQDSGDNSDEHMCGPLRLLLNLHCAARVRGVPCVCELPRPGFFWVLAAEP